ncbi:MAG: DNA polymerase III subunit alpha [Treponema sp.]|jgi:DNA polymerase-3 subunit alpha|nr:DNA polymerase III subunit alpha [Treponema sp.]
MNEFVHLHVHSDFSLQDAAVSVMSLADRAEELGMKYLALTDHGNMFGAMDFIAACRETINAEGKHQARKNPITPIIGCEVYVAPGSRSEKKGSERDNNYYHLVLLASNREGYLNLVKLCSFAYTEGFYYRPRVDEELLVKYHGGLIALSACISGEIPKYIQDGKPDEAEQRARRFRDIFGDGNFYLEIQDHGIPVGEVRGCSLSERQIYEAVAGISRRTGIPLVLTNDVHYLDREDSVAHDVLLCIGTGKLRSEERRKRYYGDQFYLKTGDEMASLFPEYPEALANTLRIAGRCTADFPRVEMKDLPRFLPDFPIPSGFADADAYLRHLVARGLPKRYPRELGGNGAAATDGSAPGVAAADGVAAAGSGGEAAGRGKEILERAEYELDTIIKMGFTGYFLIVADFINWAKEHGIDVGPGRGSGAGSIAAYALRITDIDPLKYDLLLERFLNPERISMPDFDVDFCNERRDEVIDYVTQKYGKERVGQIITFGTLGAKQVIKDVARVLGISIPESDMLTKLIPKGPEVTLGKSFKAEPRLGEMEADPRYTELFGLARKLEGLNRHSSIHAAGVVIGKSALYDFVPLYRDSKTGSIATQYTMSHLESCGLVKMDFLGLKTLDVIKNTAELIRLRGGKCADFSIDGISESGTADAEATFKMLGEGKSFEVFQFESEGMQDILRQAKPGRIEDLIALNALYRPGPMDNISQFIESKNGRRKITYPDPSLEKVLRETYGVIVYQEQVMQVARIVAGFTLGHADELRRAMGKKNMEKMIKEKEEFIAGAVERGYAGEKADEIFELLIPFAGYGFNKSHAAAYSVVAYHTAFLKANFPAEFMAANLSNEIHSADKDKLSVCIGEARKMGLEIDPPDINHSDKLFTVVEGRLVYGFLGIKGLGDASADEIIARRGEGPYKDFIDFLHRVEIKTVGKKVIELLILTGAFDAFGVPRETLQGNLERAVEHVQNIKDEKKFGQASLFGESGEKEYPDFEFHDFPETNQAEKLKIEKDLIGFYFSGHPMDEYRDLWRRAVKADLGNHETLVPGICSLVGIIKSVKIIPTSKGDKMAFASLEDYNGEIEVTFFPRAWERCCDRIEVDKAAILRGKIEYQQSRERHSFIADSCISPQEAEEAVRQEETRDRKWDKYRNIWKYAKELDLNLLDLSAAAKAKAGTYTALGVLKALRTHNDKKGGEMAFGVLQDRQAEIDLVFFSKAWKNCKAVAAEDEIVALLGSIDPANEKNPQKPSFKVSSIQDINKLVRAAAREAAEDDREEEAEALSSPAGDIAGAVHIRLRREALDRDENLYPLRDYLAGSPGPCAVFIHVPVSEGEQVIRTVTGLGAAPETTVPDALGRCAGVAEVWRE